MSTISTPEYKFRFRDSLLGMQMLFIAFGALVLVPLLTGLDPNVALFTAGVGTLLFQVITKGKVPVFLASSFAFIPAIMFGVQTWGIPATMSGLAAAGGRGRPAARSRFVLCHISCRAMAQPSVCSASRALCSGVRTTP